MDGTMAILLASMEMKKYSDPETCRAIGSPFTCEGWTIKLSNGKRQMGCIAFGFHPNGEPRIRELRLSRHLIALNDESEVLDTIRHEIAHILSDRSANTLEAFRERKQNGGMPHGPEWRRMARNVGARPEATCSTATMPAPAFRLVCGCCGTVLQTAHRRNRKTLLKSHTRCGRAGIGRLRWERNPAV